MRARYAVYAAPGFGLASPGDLLLRERAESWLGRSVSGRPVTPRAPKGWTRGDVERITVNARRYGYHGTLKAPFRLAEGRTPHDLERATAELASEFGRVHLPRLTISRIGRFFALVPGWQVGELHTLAAQVVTELDSFRAPATAAETARRRPEGLTQAQREFMHQFGYPFVMDEFRFHLTVTDGIPDERRNDVETTLHLWFDESLGRDVTIDALTIFEEPEPGAPFRLHSVHPLEGNR